MPNGRPGEIILHLYSGKAIHILASDVTYIDEDRDANGTIKGTRLVLSAVDEAGNAISIQVKEPCHAIAQQLSEIVGIGNIGDE